MFARERDVIQVLHIDNELDLIREVKLFIEKFDPQIKITQISSPEEALNLLQKQHYDCVVSEDVFSGVSSIELAQKIKKGHNIPFIIYSGNKADDSIDAIVASEIFDYLQKESNPRNYQILAKKIKTAVKKNRLEKKLSEVEVYFKNTIEQCFDIIFVMNEEGDITYISPSVERISGYKPEEIIGTSFKEFIPNKHLSKAIKAFSKAINGEKINGLELDLINKEGTPQSVEVNLSPIKKSGRVTELYGVFREAKLIETEARFRSLIEMAPDGIITMDLKGFITSINKAFLDLTGYPEEEMIGKHFTKISTVRLNDIPKYLKIFGSLLMGNAPEPFEFVYIRRNGDAAWGQGHPKLIKIGERKREVIIILRDITQIKQNENDLKNALNELERTNRDLDDYTYAVSHDLKAPLRSIESFSSFLLEDYYDALDDTGRDYLNRMRDSTFRMKNLIDDLLLLSRIGRRFTKTEYVDFNILMKEVKLDFESTIKEIKGKIFLDKLPTIKTQKVWVRQLFANLISNGLKFNKSKEPKVWISYEEREDDYLFSVKDNGIGIEKKHHLKIFDIFQRLHTQDEYPGTGAGLTICKKIIDSFGGEIWIESKLGKGSTFYFTIPKEQIEEVESQPQTDQQVTQIQNGMQIQTE